MTIPHELTIVGLLLLFLGIPGIAVIAGTLYVMRRFNRLVENRLGEEMANRAGSGSRSPGTGRTRPGTVVALPPRQPDLEDLAKNIAQARLLVGRQHTGRSRYVVAATTVDEMRKRSPPPPVDVVVATWLAAVQSRRPVDESFYADLGFSEHSLKIVTALSRSSTSKRALGDVESVYPPAGFDRAQLHVWQARYIEIVGEPVRQIESGRMSALGRDGELAFETFD